MLGTTLSALGFLTAVGGPVITAAVANPLLASNQQLQKILAYAGLVVFLAGVAHDALLKWQSSDQTHKLAMAKMKITPPVEMR